MTALLQVSPREAKEEKARRVWQRNFTLYKERIFRRYRRALHLDEYDRLLMEVAKYATSGGKEGIGFLISEFPPRHGKTMSLFRLFPTWYLGNNPDHRIMGVSYGATLAEKNSRLARNLMMSPWYREIFPDVMLDPASKAADAWNIYGHEGGMDAMGVLGGATGKGANILICDDLIKSREEAESDTIRDRTWDGLIDDLLTRLEPGGAIILNGTRWHMDDPIGRAVLNLQHLRPYRFRLPALAEENDPLGRAVGDALWPARFPLKTLHEIKRTLGDYSWSALYQQEPVPSEGGIFKRAWFEPLLLAEPPMLFQVRGWDLAMSEKTSADYTASVKLGVHESANVHVLDVTRQRVDWGDLVEYMAQIILNDGPDVLQGIEMKGYMSRAVAALNADPRLHGYSVFGFDVDKDKLTRALPFAAKAGAGMVQVLHRSWSEMFVEELCSFPNGAHDDLVDASSIALEMLGGPMTGYAGGLTHDDTTYTGIGTY